MQTSEGKVHIVNIHFMYKINLDKVSFLNIPSETSQRERERKEKMEALVLVVLTLTTIRIYLPYIREGVCVGGGRGKGWEGIYFSALTF